MFISKINAVAIFTILFLFVFSLCGDIPFANGTFVYKNWRAEQGLPTSSINGVYQDSKGYIWVATFAGIVRFDGHRFVTFNKVNTEELSTDFYRHIYESSNGDIYFTSPYDEEGGLFRLRKGVFKRFGTNDGLSSETAHNITEVEGGDLWVGTRTNGISVIGKTSVRTLSIPDGLKDSRISAIAQDKEGKIWIGTWTGGLHYYENGKVLPIDSETGFDNKNVTDIAVDNDGNIFVGTMESGLFIKRGDRFFNYNLPEGESSISNIHIDRSGNIWIGTFSQGLFLFNGRSFVRTGISAVVKDPMVTGITNDKEGNLWIGTMSSGLYMIMPSSIRTLPDKNLNREHIASLFFDRQERMWISTYKSNLVMIDKDRIIRLGREQGIPDAARTISQTNEEKIWLGFDEGGLYKADPEGIIPFPEEKSPEEKTVLALFTDSKGTLWYSTDRKKIYIYNNNSFQLFDRISGLLKTSVNMFREDSDGNIWMLTSSGVLKYFEGSIKTFGKDEGVPVAFISDFHEDDDGTKWLSTIHSISFFDGEKFVTSKKRHPMFESQIVSLNSDQYGKLWVGTNSGLVSADRIELKNWILGKTDSFSYRRYGTSDGMPSIECNGGQNSTVKDKAGNIWFATIGGIAFFNPETIGKERSKPASIIEEVKVDGKIINEPGIVLPPSTQKVVFTYTGIYYRSPEEINYKYRLDGFEKDWTDADNSRVASYSNLPPGNYRFIVKSCAGDGVCDQIEPGFSFSVTPYFYQTIWFKVISWLTLISLISLLVFRKISSVKKEKDELSEIVDEQNAELDTMASELKDKYETAKLDDETVEHYKKALFGYMEDKKPYLDSLLKLKTVAKETRIPPHHLSQLLNCYIGKSFYQFINEYRIQNAVDILKDPKNKKNILEVAYESGFNSKSTFNVMFKKIMGQTPSDFLKN